MMKGDRQRGGVKFFSVLGVAIVLANLVVVGVVLRAVWAVAMWIVR